MRPLITVYNIYTHSLYLKPVNNTVITLNSLLPSKYHPFETHFLKSFIV